MPLADQPYVSHYQRRVSQVIMDQREYEGSKYMMPLSSRFLFVDIVTYRLFDTEWNFTASG